MVIGTMVAVFSSAFYSFTLFLFPFSSLVMVAAVLAANIDLV